MMNLLARIMSHGFSLIVVALIALGLMYRGELFPEWELPAFLSSGDQQASVEGAESVPQPGGSADGDWMSPVSPQPAQSAEQVATDSQVDSPSVASLDSPVPDQQESATDSEADSSVDISREDASSTAAPVSNADLSKNEAEIPPVPADIAETKAVITESVKDTENVVDLAVHDAAVAAEVIPEETVTEETVTEETLTEETVSSPAKTETLQPVDASVTEVIVSPAAEEVTAAVEPVETETKIITVADAASEPVEPPGAEESTGTAAEQIPEPSQPTPVMGSEPSSPYQMLAAAREAYWLRDYVAAEEHYQRLLQMEPDNPDGYGELGNLYFSQGKWEQAAAVYYEAGIRLLDDGLLVQARQLVDVIRGLNGTQADELENKIESARTGTP